MALTDSFGGVALDQESTAPETRTLPVTFYSLGKAVGGTDEAQDKWTNRGYSSQGPNLTPGIVAVNDREIPQGSILRDKASGQVFLASDRHGNEDAKVVDIYVPPDMYQAHKGEREFEIVGQADEIPQTADGVRELLAQYGTVPAGESAAESLARMNGGPAVGSTQTQPDLRVDGHPVAAGTTMEALQALQAAKENIDGAQYETKLTAPEEQQFQAWKAKYAPRDSGVDYDLRGAFKAGLTPDPKTGHWPDTFKKPNEPTFSNESMYAKDRPDLAGKWDGETFVPPTRRASGPVQDQFGGVAIEDTPVEAPKLSGRKDEFGGLALDDPPALDPKKVWRIENGHLLIEPQFLKAGLKQAHDAGVLDDEGFAKLSENADQTQKAAREYKRLEIEAGDNPEMKAVLHGVGKGSAMTLGALGGGAVGAAVAPATGPAAPVVPIVTGAVGMVAAGAAYDAAYRKLADWNDNYRQVLDSSKLKPGWNAAGELAFLAVQVPASAMRMANAIRTVAELKGAGDAAKFALAAVGTSAGVAAATDTGVRVVQRAAGDKEVPAPSVGTALEAAAAGVLTSGLMVEGKRYSLRDLYGIAEKVANGHQLTAGEKVAWTMASDAVKQVRAEGGTVQNVSVEQASLLGKPEATRPTVTIGNQALPEGAAEAGNARVDLRRLPPGSAQEQFENLQARIGQPVEGQEAPAPVTDEFGGVAVAEGDEQFAPPVEAETPPVAEDPFALDGTDEAATAEGYVEGGDVEAATQARRDSQERARHRQAIEAEIADALRAEREASGSVELLDAVADAGGLPTRGHQHEAAYRGELDMVRESAKADKRLALFRKDAPAPDVLAASLREKGFAVEGPNDLWDLLDQRLRGGQEVWSEPQRGDDYWQQRQGFVMEPPRVGIKLKDVGNDFPVDPVKPRLVDPAQLKGRENDAAEQMLMRYPENITAADGSRIKLQNPEGGSLPHRARHLAMSEGRILPEKLAWMPMVPETLKNAAVRIVDSKSGYRIYVRAYEGGTKHMVVVRPDGQVVKQRPFRGSLWTQFPGGSNRQQEMEIDWVRPGLEKMQPPPRQPSGHASAAWDSPGGLDAGGNKPPETPQVNEPFTPTETAARGDQAAEALGTAPVTRITDTLRQADNAGDDFAAQEKLVALGWRRDMLRTGKVDFIGRAIRNSYDLAMAAQVYRDPRFETVRWLFTRNGKVVDTIGITSRNPRMTMALLPGHSVEDMVAMARKVKADGIWLLHNHPSGDPTPSGQDVKLTRWVGAATRKAGLSFHGHVIINGKRFARLNHEGRESIHDLPGRDRLLQPEFDHAMLKLPMGDAAQVQQAAEVWARLAADQRDGDGQVTLFLQETNGSIRAVTTIPVGLFLDRQKFAEYLHSRGPLYGVSFATAYYDAPEHRGHVADAMVEYVQGAILEDGLLSPREAVRAERGARPEVPGDRYFGEDIMRMPGAARVHEPTAQEIEEAGGRLAEEALKDGPLRIVSADGKNHYANVVLAGLPDVRIIEMPELVALTKELTGSEPRLRRMRSALGQMTPEGQGRITLDPRIFADHTVAAKVLAHELGHIADWLPEKSLKRGNIIGRLYSLKKHLNARAFGSSTGIEEKKVRAELEALTKYWKPWDEATAPKWYTAYRKSSVELYADAISVLFNSPATLKKMAPVFYREFFAWLDKKPEVKTAFFELQALLSQPKMELLRARSSAAHAMFAKAEEVFLRTRERARQWHLTPRGWLDLLREQLYDKYDPIVRRQRQVEKGGATVPDELRMDYLFDEHPLADNLTYTWLKRMWQRVVQPLEAAEISLEDLGEYLFFSRVMADRSEMANPQGHTPVTARAALLRMRLDLGQKKFALMEHHAAQFHDYVFDTVREAAEAGIISQETFKNVIEPNRKTYAAFRPIDYVEDYVPAGVYQQIGTLKEIENPWLTTILKTIAMRRAIQHQRAKAGTVEFLQTYFPGEIQPAQTRFDGRRPVPQPPKDREKGLLEVREDGQWKGYEVPADVARMFDRADPAQASAVLRALNWIFRKGFYNVWVRFNPVFQLAYSPLRDAQRFYTNMPKAGAMKLAANYLKSMPAAIRRLLGNDDPIVTEMYETLALSTPHDSFARNATRDDAFEEILRQFHVLPEAEQGGWRKNMLVKPALGFLRGIEFAGQVLEASPKIAAYKILTRDLGWSTRDAASYVRNYVGVPNYLRRGKHAVAAGSLLPFWNVAVQGLASDGALMTGRDRKKSAASWWFRWALAGGLYAILQALARNGLMGDDAKEWYEGVSDYDNTNYMIVPLGVAPGGDHGRKVVYLRMPQDEMHRITNGVLKKFIEIIVRHSEDKATKPVMQDLGALAGYAGGQLPGVNPAVGIAAKWKDYMDGVNPYDTFRDRHVLSNAQYLAGGWESLKPMLSMTWNDAGLGNFYRYNPEADSTLEMVLSNIPLAQRLVKVSDRGYAERQRAGIEAGQAQDARLRLAMPDNVQKLAREYYFLRSLGKARTPQQSARYDQLKVWNRTIYTPAYERAQTVQDSGGTVNFSGLGAASKPWE